MRKPFWWLRSKWEPTDHETGAVTVTITADVTGFIDGMRRAQEAIKRSDVGARRFKDAIERAVVGAEARFLVRGGLDPDYADPAARDLELRRLAAVPWFGPRVAAAFLRGWIDTYGRDLPHEPYEFCSRWDRRVEVSAA